MSDYGDPFERLARAIRSAAREESRSEHGVRLYGHVRHLTPLRIELPARGITLEQGADELEVTNGVVASASVGDGVEVFERESGWAATGLFKA